MNELINKTTDIRCIFRPAFGCCALQTLIETVIFSVFYAKKLKKARNLQQIFAKKQLFLNKTVDQRFGANLKKHVFFKKFAANFLLFLAFLHKNC